MNTIKSIILSIFVFSCLALHAQSEYQEHHSHADTTDERGEHNVGWMHSHILDNWMIGLQGGGQLYCGFEDFKGPLGSHLTGNIEGFVGRWIFPMVGIRAVGGYGTSHGFITLDSYNANRGALIGNGGYGTSDGIATTIRNSTSLPDGALGCYYFPLDDQDNLLIQKWNYLYAGADFIVNFSYLKRYDRVRLDRKWENMGYVGFNIRMGISEAHIERFSDKFGRSTINGNLVNTNFAAEGHIGYILGCNISKHLSIHLDARLSLLEGLFDREKLPGVENMTPDMNINVMGGLTYNFHFRNKVKRFKYFVGNNILPYNVEPDSLPRFVNYVQWEEIENINITDTLLVYIVDTVNSEEIIQKKKEYEEKRQNLINQFNDIPVATPLNSILKKRMLPYEMVFFKLDKWDILPQEEIKIAKMARIMKAFPEYKFILYGSADSKTGTVKRNWFLSENRADVVYNMLVYQYDIPKEQLKREYLGGILDYDPYILNRTTVIIMDHPAVRHEFEEMKSQRKAGGGVATF